ncbi:MAG: hypothetical protein LQ338_002454 [Usnochroma carphineum]|nr:MAG: hypothetical protein LQ338_002454 [Usnochroma carphineum]
MHYHTLFSVVFTTLTITPSILTHAIPKPIALTSAPAGDLAVRASDNDPVPFPFDEAHASYIEDAFETIASIPDSVLDDGPEAVKQWVLAHESNPQPQTRSATLVARQGWFQVAKCAFAIGKAIVENALPISKLRRVKELIEVLGGAKAVAKMLLKAKSIKEMIIIGGPELQELTEIFLGITDVVNDCFSF